VLHWIALLAIAAPRRIIAVAVLFVAGAAQLVSNDARSGLVIASVAGSDNEAQEYAAELSGQVAFIRMFGLGLPLAVLVDATLVRMVLLPAFMHVLSQWNWWAPKPLTRLHARIGISEN